ncbi:aspartyl-phosphate phosphatase Spo0E family protein [Caloramator proteoclasticus]|uniref:Spo0E like sporulation regulatory protein n=1 Tax=Caloramator proteoclasticus DSM 10124 TaxID=1121262 RepID=A0A1M5AKW8_9CLOT|nr:aspartyl-phosphate phosphatase Spo0E family protein [Caloramator proteoclasticus]SHF30815.1 Spo0E like sporulation regulatory protein [Caloramator proteoclasticus DSM 10124]
MKNLRIKIDKLKELLERKLKENDYATNEEIVKISQELDEYIVIYQKKYQNKKVV